MSVSPSAKVKKLLLTSQLKALEQCDQEADQLLAKTLPDDETLRDAEYATLGEFIHRFETTITKGQELFEEMAEIVFEFVASKSAEKIVNGRTKRACVRRNSTS